MPIRHWVLVPDDHGEAILKQDQSVASRAKRAFCLLVLIGRSDSPEVSVIPVPLHSVALIAECLKIADLVPASFDARRYVVHLQSALVSRDAAKFAAELGCLEHFITQSSTDVASASPGGVPR
jgi:hypothetical protein